MVSCNKGSLTVQTRSTGCIQSDLVSQLIVWTGYHQLLVQGTKYDTDTYYPPYPPPIRIQSASTTGSCLRKLQARRSKPQTLVYQSRYQAHHEFYQVLSKRWIHWPTTTYLLTMDPSDRRIFFLSPCAPTTTIPSHWRSLVSNPHSISLRMRRVH